MFFSQRFPSNKKHTNLNSYKLRISNLGRNLGRNIGAILGH